MATAAVASLPNLDSLPEHLWGLAPQLPPALHDVADFLAFLSGEKLPCKLEAVALCPSPFLRDEQVHEGLRMVQATSFRRYL